MIANYGYTDGAGDFYISIDTDKCDGCGDCAEICPARVFEMVEDEFDIDAEIKIAAVKKSESKKIKYACAICKPTSGYKRSALPCVTACKPGAIDHSW